MVGLDAVYPSFGQPYAIQASHLTKFALLTQRVRICFSNTMRSTGSATVATICVAWQRLRIEAQGAGWHQETSAAARITGWAARWHSHLREGSQTRWKSANARTTISWSSWSNLRRRLRARHRTGPA